MPGGTKRLLPRLQANGTVPNLSAQGRLAAGASSRIDKHRLYMRDPAGKLAARDRSEDRAHGLIFEVLPADPPSGGMSHDRP